MSRDPALFVTELADGNMRTAYIACRTFLVLNGAHLVPSEEAKFLTVLALAEGHLEARYLANGLRTHGAAAADRQVQEHASN